MKILGITGGIGSGKSTVAKLFENLGAYLIDADAIARDVMKKDGEAYCEVVANFGPEILTENNEIDRKKLASIVFSDKDKLSNLNRVTHKYIYKQIKALILSSNAKLVCLDVPLLFTAEFPIECDKTLVVIADHDKRITRVSKRSGLTAQEIIDRMRNQMSDKEMCERADYCIDNSGVPEDIIPEVKEIYYRMTES